jgi:EAL domain-containing protein (putative c-di-GMP-specific phosphodiesterase class I)
MKIDKSFVLDMVDDERTRQLVHSMIELAQNLQLEVVAEGVEDAETLQLLSDFGCDYAQGYFIGRPQPAGEFLAAQTARTPAPAV